MSTKRDYYDILGVTKNSSATEIKSAYRKMALQFHPDRNKAPDAEDKFKEINEAYEVLSNPDKKQAYDQFGHAAFDPASGGPFASSGAPGRTGPFNYTYYTSTGSPGDFADMFGGFSDPFEIFESFFGGRMGGRPAKPHYSLKIDFLDAIRGVSRTIVHQGRQHTIKIPAGSDNGTRIRYDQFDVSVDVLPDPYFKRDGNDIYVDYELPFSLAILGTDIRVRTLDKDDLKIKVRPGTQPGTVIRLSGVGAKDVHSHRRGDFYIRLIIKLPTRISNRQKQLLEQFDQN